MTLTSSLTLWDRLLHNLNGPWHHWALRLYLAVVLAHWVEHVLQAVQIFVLHWPRPESRGALGLLFPWLVSSESLHYFYAIFMLIGLLLLRPGFVGRGRLWWNISLGIQFWHHVEHALLLGQVLLGMNLLGHPVPTSTLQLFIPRAELHLFYNAAVFVPMLIAMFYHLYPPRGDKHKPACACAYHAPRLASEPAG